MIEQSVCGLGNCN